MYIHKENSRYFETREPPVYSCRKILFLMYICLTVKKKILILMYFFITVMKKSYFYVYLHNCYEKILFLMCVYLYNCIHKDKELNSYCISVLYNKHIQQVQFEYRHHIVTVSYCIGLVKGFFVNRSIFNKFIIIIYL